MEDEILICAFVGREWWETFVALEDTLDALGFFESEKRPKHEIVTTLR